jgi:hypothetical protein
MNTADAVGVRLLLLACCLLAATACDEDIPTGPTVPLNERFVLAPGGVVAIPDARASVQFVGVTGDSRCPADAFCIQGGDAIVQVRVFDTGEVASYDLHSGDSRRASIVHRGFRLELVELQPYPFSSRTIDPADYRATLIASR